MARQKEFVNYLLELLQPLGNVTAKAMFGGHGIYKDGLILGIVFDDTLYLKADDVSRGEFDERGLRPFVFESKARGKQVSIGYYQCPEDALESAVLMVDWAKTAYGAALRETAKKKGVNKRATEASAKNRCRQAPCPRQNCVDRRLTRLPAAFKPGKSANASVCGPVRYIRATRLP